MFHLSAFAASIANDGDLHQLAAVPDSIYPESGEGLLSTGLGYLMAVGFLGTLWDSPPRLDDLSRKMVPLAVPEEWDMSASQTNAMDAETEYGFLWSSDNIINPVPPKKIVQIHWSTSQTLASGTWSLIQMEMAQPLTSGTYALVGARCLSAGALAFRFVPSGSPVGQNWRPGGIGVQSPDQMDWPLQRKGGWGTWLNFTNITVPQVEVFSISDDTSLEGIIDIVPF